MFYDPLPIGISLKDIEEGASRLPDPIAVSGPRLVIHIQTSEKAVHDFLQLVHDLSQARKHFASEDDWRSRIKGEGEIIASKSAYQ